MSDIQIFIQDKDNEGEWRDIEEGLLDLSSHDAKVRNKAIDDFAEKLIRYVDCGHLCSPTEVIWSDLSVVEMVKKLAEQLKAGGENEN